MDETEDEEVKRNCFGMKHYESSSDEESCSDESEELGGCKNTKIQLAFFSNQTHLKNSYIPFHINLTNWIALQLSLVLESHPLELVF